MSKTGKVLLVVGIAGLITYGVATFAQQQKLIQASRITLEGQSIHVNSPTSVNLTTNVNLNNQSSLAFSIVNYSLSVYLDNVLIGSNSSTQTVHVDKKASNNIPISINFNPVTILGQELNLSSISSALDQTISVRGYLVVNNKIFFAKIPVNIDRKLGDFL